MPTEEIAKVCLDHPLAILRVRITGLNDPKIVTLGLRLTIVALYFMLY